jgi:hypothetical protein
VSYKVLNFSFTLGPFQDKKKTIICMLKKDYEKHYCCVI